MPKEKHEAREEDSGQRLTLKEQILRDTVHPPKEGKHSNAILASNQSVPMAELTVIANHWEIIINHQKDKAILFKESLPVDKDALNALIEKRKKDLESDAKQIKESPKEFVAKYYPPLPKYDQITYQEKIDAFTDAKTGFRLLSRDLVDELCDFSLSVMGAHHKRTEDLKQSIISSEDTNNNNPIM